MKGFVDIHSHMLFGLDDGAPSKDKMLEMLELAYDDGIRGVCLTPHYYNPVSKRPEKTISYGESFGILSEYVRNKYPDMRLWQGNEVFFHHDCIKNLESGDCLTLGGSRYVLVEFFPDEECRTIMGALRLLLNSGFLPILAHAERYPELYSEIVKLKELTESGMLIQINAGIVTGGLLSPATHFANKLLKNYLVSFIGSDAHDTEFRKPVLSEAYKHIKRKYSEEYARALLAGNAVRMLEKR